jgi:hypothetical protein
MSTYQITKEQMNIFLVILDDKLEEWEKKQHAYDGWNGYHYSKEQRDIMKKNRELCQRIKFELKQIIREKGLT